MVSYFMLTGDPEESPAEIKKPVDQPASPTETAASVAIPDGSEEPSAEPAKTVSQTIPSGLQSTESAAMTFRHFSLVMSVCFSSDGKRLASGSRDKTVKVRDAATGQEKHTLKGQDVRPRSAYTNIKHRFDYGIGFTCAFFVREAVAVHIANSPDVDLLQIAQDVSTDQHA